MQKEIFIKEVAGQADKRDRGVPKSLQGDNTMPIRTDIHTQELLVQFRAQRQSTEKPEAGASTEPVTISDSVSFRSQSIVELEAKVRSAGSGSADQVDISLTGNMTIQAANGILKDSLIDKINQVFEEAGMDVTVEEMEDLGEEMTPEATAGRIVAFATSFLESFKANHVEEAPTARIEGFIALIRDAISDGFARARDFLEGITKLSETVDESINKTFEITNTLLDEFHQAQLDGMAAAGDPEESAQEDAGPAPLTEGLV